MNAHRILAARLVALPRYRHWRTLTALPALAARLPRGEGYKF
jgi:hypothetical protein